MVQQVNNIPWYLSFSIGDVISLLGVVATAMIAYVALRIQRLMYNRDLYTDRHNTAKEIRMVLHSIKDWSLYFSEMRNNIEEKTPDIFISKQRVRYLFNEKIFDVLCKIEKLFISKKRSCGPTTPFQGDFSREEDRRIMDEINQKAEKLEEKVELLFNKYKA